MTYPDNVQTLADYSLTSNQDRYAATGASITNGQIGGGSGTSFDGGSLTVNSNTQNALAQSNSAPTA